MTQDRIRRMYEEIVDYDGDFGDPIEGLESPFARLRSSDLASSDRTGWAVAALCLLSCGVDNSTHEAALREFGGQVRAAVDLGLCGEEDSVRGAFEAFLESEASFLRGLALVY